MNAVLPGMEVLLKRGIGSLGNGARLGMLVNQASVDARCRPYVEEIIRQSPSALRVLFSPQHGLWGEKQANMITSPSEPITPWGVRCVSLYGPSRRPPAEELQRLDVLLVDLQDVGCRVYTFASTMKACMEVCAELGVKVVVADRPNPIDGVHVEGNLLKRDMISIVGAHPIPMRHGLTMGELALMFQRRCPIGVELEVVPMEGWHRGMLFHKTGLTWVPPSPNLPCPDSCMVYPGQVLLEGTNLSEGRGTTRPFEVFGAPFVDPFALKGRLDSRGLEGVVFRAVYFEPTFDKWRGMRCGGLQIHVFDPESFRPYLTSLWILREVMDLWPEHFQWRAPPYEYEQKRLPIDLLMGDRALREGLEAGCTPDQLQERWMPALRRWMDRREEHLVYHQ